MAGVDQGRVRWRTATGLGGSVGGVEVGATAHGVAIRYSKRAGAPVLEISRDDWEIFLAAMQGGDFDDI